MLLRLIEVVAEGVAGLGDDTVAEGCKTRLDTFSPIVKVLDGVMFSLIGSNGDDHRLPIERKAEA